MSEPPEQHAEPMPASDFLQHATGDADFPRLPQAVLLTVFTIAVMLVVNLGVVALRSALGLELGAGWETALVNTLALGLVVSWGCRRTGLSFRHVLRFETFTPRLLLPLLFFTLGASIVFSDFDNLLRSVWPMPPWIAEGFEALMDGGWGSLLAVVVVAPVSEELLFRGLILRGLIIHRGVAGGIFYSALLFGFLHLNPWQFCTAFPMGLVLGWLFVRTRSLWPCILAHAALNGLTIGVAVYAERWGLSIPGYTGDPFGPAVFQPVWFDLLGGFLVVGSLAWMRVLLVRDAKRGLGGG